MSDLLSAAEARSTGDCAAEELRRLLAEQNAAERELRCARKGRRPALEARLVDLCE
jgi:hypothetical protein